jgi:chromosome segregation ATPase
MKTKWIYIGLLMVLSSSFASAEDDPMLALQKAQTMLKLLQQEKNKLQEEKLQLTQQVNQLTAERDALKAQAGESALAAKELAATKKQFAQTQQRLAGLESEHQVLNTERSRLADTLQNAKQKLGNLSEQNNKTEEALQTSSAELSKYKDQFEQCHEKNGKFAKLTAELLDSYKKKGVMQALLQAEPITQVKRVEIDNLVQDYQQQLRDNALSKAAPNP